MHVQEVAWVEEMVQAAKAGSLRTGTLNFADRVFQNDIYVAIQETRQVCHQQQSECIMMVCCFVHVVWVHLMFSWGVADMSEAVIQKLPEVAMRGVLCHMLSSTLAMLLCKSR